MRRFALIAATTCLLIGGGFYVYYAYRMGKFDLMHRSVAWIIEVNGIPVQADVLVGRLSTVVTRRDKGKEHSYLLLYASDVDYSGTIGQARDCRNWVAPKLPILIRTSTYPIVNCDEERASRILLTSEGVHFTTMDREMISIGRR
jgi:hypothetical protein